jgi:hypothetical protein
MGLARPYIIKAITAHRLSKLEVHNTNDKSNVRVNWALVINSRYRARQNKYPHFLNFVHLDNDKSNSVFNTEIDTKLNFINVCAYNFVVCAYMSVYVRGDFTISQLSKSRTTTESYSPTKEGLASFSSGSKRSFNMVNRLGELNTHLEKKNGIVNISGMPSSEASREYCKISDFQTSKIFFPP